MRIRFIVAAHREFAIVAWIVAFVPPVSLVVTDISWTACFRHEWRFVVLAFVAFATPVVVRSCLLSWLSCIFLSRFLGFSEALGCCFGGRDGYTPVSACFRGFCGFTRPRFLPVVICFGLSGAFWTVNLQAFSLALCLRSGFLPRRARGGLCPSRAGLGCVFGAIFRRWQSLFRCGSLRSVRLVRSSWWLLLSRIVGFRSALPTSVRTPSRGGGLLGVLACVLSLLAWRLGCSGLRLLSLRWLRLRLWLFLGLSLRSFFWFFLFWFCFWLWLGFLVPSLGGGYAP